MTSWKSLTLVLWMSFGSVVVGAAAADTAAPAASSPSIVCRRIGGPVPDPTLDEGEPSGPATGLTVADLRPSFYERLASALTLTMEWNDVEDFLFEEETVDEPGQAARTVVTPHRNPDGHLWKATGAMDLSRLFVNPEHLAALYGTVAKNDGLFDTTRERDPLKNVEDKVGFFTRAGSGYQLYRFLSAISLSAAVSRRKSVDGIRDREGTEETLSLRIDFRRPLNREARLRHGYEALIAYAGVYGTKGWEPNVEPCAKPTHRECLRQVSGASPKRRWARALLPVFELEMKDQFDFLQAGGDFVTSPLVEDTLEVYTLTWDLSDVFDSLRQGKRGIEILRSIEKLSAPPPTIRPPAEIRPAAGRFFYHQLEAEGGAGPITWTVEGCQPRDGGQQTATCVEEEALPGVRLTPQGLLVGPLGDGASELVFTATAEDDFGRAGRLGCELHDSY